MNNQERINKMTVEELQQKLEEFTKERRILSGIPCEPDSKVGARKTELDFIIAGLQQEIRRRQRRIDIQLG